MSPGTCRGSKNTVFRAGYGINYIGNVDFLTLNTGVGNFPGQTLNTSYVPQSFLNVAGVAAAGVVPVTTNGAQPFTPVSFTNRATGLYGYTTISGRRMSRASTRPSRKQTTNTVSLDVNFIGNKGSRLYTNQQLDDTNIFENGILNGFNAVRAGGDSPLFDQMLNGITIPGVGTVNNTTLTGSQALRTYTRYKHVSGQRIGWLSGELLQHQFGRHRRQRRHPEPRGPAAELRRCEPAVQQRLHDRQ